MGRASLWLECIFCYTALHTTKNQYYQYYLIYSVSSAPQINLQELTLDTLFFFLKLAQRAQTYTVHSSPALPSPGFLHLQSWASALLFGEASTVCVCVGGCTGVKSVTTLWAWGGSTEAERWSGYSWSESVVRCVSTNFCTGYRQGGVMAATGPNSLPEVQCLIFFITVIHKPFHSVPR